MGYHVLADILNRTGRSAEAMTVADRPVEAHYIARGGHGFGPGRAGDGTHQWLGLLADWIKRQ